MNIKKLWKDQIFGLLSFFFQSSENTPHENGLIELRIGKVALAGLSSCL